MSPTTTMIELISRAVIISDAHLLCVRRKGSDNIFLPGGHVDKGETAPQALERELEEELGVAVKTGEFLGIVEHAYENEKNGVQEINLIFRIENVPFNPLKPVPSAEPHLELLWLECRETILQDHNLQPWILQTSLPEYLNNKNFPSYLSTI